MTDKTIIGWVVIEDNTQYVEDGTKRIVGIFQTEELAVEFISWIGNKENMQTMELEMPTTEEINFLNLKAEYIPMSETPENKTQENSESPEIKLGMETVFPERPTVCGECTMYWPHPGKRGGSCEENYVQGAIDKGTKACEKGICNE